MLEQKETSQKHRMSFYHNLATTLVMNLVLKACTFVLMLYLTHILSPSETTIGIVYTAYLDTIFNFSRGVIRSATSRLNLKVSKKASDNVSSSVSEGLSDSIPNSNEKLCNLFSYEAVCSAVNLSALCIPFTLLMMVSLELCVLVTGVSIFPSLWCNIWKTMPPHSLRKNHVQENQVLAVAKHFILAFFPEFMVSLSALIRCFSEPYIPLLQALDKMHVNITADFLSNTARLVTAMGLTHFFGKVHSSWQIRMVFASAQLVHALIIVLYYALLYSSRTLAQYYLGESHTFAELHAAFLTNSTKRNASKGDCQVHMPFPWCSIDLKQMARVCIDEIHLLWAFFFDNLFHLSISSAHNFVIINITSAADRGIYHYVANLGTIAVRQVFNLWENACSARWSQDAVGGNIDAAIDLLCVMMRLAFYFAFSFTLLVSPMTDIILKKLYTKDWATDDAIHSLRWFFYSLPLVAEAGLLETFVRATASLSMLHNLQRITVINSILSIAFTYLSLRYRVKESSKGSEGTSAHGTGPQSAAVLCLTAASIFSTVCRLCFVTYLLFFGKRGYSIAGEKSGAHSSLLYDGSSDKEMNKDGGSTSASDTNSSLKDKSGVFLTLQTFKRATISPHLATYLVLLLACTLLMSFSLVKICLVGLFYVAGILYWDDVVSTSLFDTLSKTLRIGQKKKNNLIDLTGLKKKKES